ncbi:hypothetical protein [Halorientalis marina]|nr:hypothetical protein [Halorientalis marina]
MPVLPERRPVRDRSRRAPAPGTDRTVAAQPPYLDWYCGDHQ